jgi:hypothetical protein
MVRVCLFLHLLVMVFTMNGQNEKQPFRYQSILKATATITPGFLLNNKQTNIYLNGELEYFLDDKLSFRTDGFWMAGAQEKPSLLQQNNSIFFGALYHIHKNRFDYFFGLQPGLFLTKPNTTNDAVISPYGVTVTYKTDYDYKLLPSLSPITGITFYVSDYFNFFLNIRYVYARYYGYENAVLNIDEFRVSAGLGFQIHTRKVK